MNGFFNSNNKEGESISFKSSASTFAASSSVTNSVNGASWLFSADTKIQSITPNYNHGVAEVYDVKYMYHDLSRVYTFDLSSTPEVFSELDFSKFKNCISYKITNSNVTGFTFPNTSISSTPLTIYVNNNKIKELDFSPFTNLGISATIRAHDNNLMTAITLSSSGGTLNTFWMSFCPLMTEIDLSGLNDISGNFFLNNNSSLSSVTFPTIVNALTDLRLYSCDFKSLDLTPLTNFSTKFDISTNINLTAITFPTTSTEIISGGFNNLTSIPNLTLTGLTGIREIRFSNNTSMTTIAFPSHSLDIISIYGGGCDLLTDLDFSPLSGFGGIFSVASSGVLSGITFPNSSNTWTSPNFSSCNFNYLDLSSMSGLTGTLNISSNVNLTGITFPSTTRVTGINANGSDLYDTVDLSPLSNLGGTIEFEGNANLDTLTFPNTSQSITKLSLSSCGFVGELNLNILSGLNSYVATSNISTLTNIVFPTTSAQFTNLYLYQCDLDYIDFNPISGGTSNGIVVWLNDNAMAVADVNHILYDLDSFGWTGGTLRIEGTNDAPDGSSGGFNGTGATENLTAKSWTITKS